MPLLRYIEEVRDNDETFVEAFKFAQTQVWRDMLNRVHSSESNIIECRDRHYGICQMNYTTIVWEVKSINRDKTAHMLLNYPFVTIIVKHRNLRKTSSNVNCKPINTFQQKVTQTLHNVLKGYE